MVKVRYTAVFNISSEINKNNIDTIKKPDTDVTENIYVQSDGNVMNVHVLVMKEQF